MHCLIIGAAGMVGAKLTQRIVREGCLGAKVVERLTLVDVVTPTAPAGWTGGLALDAADLADEGVAARLIADRPDVIFHLAAIVSGEAEADLDKGYRVNLDGTRALLDAIRDAGRRAPYRPRVVFASSIAVFGAPFPAQIPDDFFLTPLTSYGTQKAMSELMLADYSRRGLIEGIGLRLPTLCIRPGRPNKAASGFFSNILREPLNGQEAVLPVEESVRHWFASPRAAIGFLVHGATMDLDKVGPRRNLTMPGLSATVGEELAALERFAGPAALKLIRREPDPVIQRIVAGWATDFDASRAAALGFVAETSFDEIVRAYIEEDRP